MLISNAVASNTNKSILYSRLLIIGLLDTSYIIYSNIFIKPLENGLSLYNGLFTVNVLSQCFNIFIFIIASIIGVLGCFYIEKVSQGEGNNKVLVETNDTSNKSYLIDINLNKNHLQFNIIEYALIMLFILCGAVFLISASDLVSLFLSIELQSYGLYIIATIYRNSESSTGSGLTYFLLGGLSSCFILLGSAVLYVNSGITNLDNIYILNSISEFTTSNNSLYYVNGASNYINFSLIILAVGLLFKISAAPFHFWSPDVYDGVPTIVTTFIAIIPKISLLNFMLNLVTYSDINNNNMYQETEVYQDSYNVSGNWKNILVLSSLMSLLIGSILGLSQYRIKRLFAYSTISHVGFILLALCINKIESIQAYIFYILQYSVSNLNAFFILIMIGYTLATYIYMPSGSKSLKYDNVSGKLNDTFGNSKVEKDATKRRKQLDTENSPIQLLSQIKGYFYINTFISLSFAITLFSFVGIPPLIGFFAKQMVLSSALDEGYVFMTLIAVITSVIGAAYYLNMIKLIFFSKSDYVLESIIKKDNTKAYYGRDNDFKESKLYNNSVNSMLINDKLSIIISILTMLILLFIFMPDEWFRIVNIASLSINKS